MNRFFLFAIGSLLLGCSSQDAFRTDATKASDADSSLSNQPLTTLTPQLPLEISTETLSTSQSGSLSFLDSPTIVNSDTLNVAADSLAGHETFITEQLEEARQHYLAALSAQEAKDSTLCAEEFEYAIHVLDELSYLPGIESNKEFTDLSQNVIEDYEKYIASIDDVSPEASVFALREKLNEIIEKVDISKVNIPEEVITGTSVPLLVNEHVERNIAFFMGERGRLHFEKWLELSGKFFPMMKRIFKEEQVPEELIYLSMIESGLRPDARSWAKAVGLWQFMTGTGRTYGLRGNWWYDERRDFEKSTRAAARHMKDLFSEFGDWHVVLAAYNSGAGNVYKATRRSGSTDYWGMRPFLPKETRNFVPIYIAVVRMASNPEQYGFHGITPADSLAYDIVTLDDCVDLSVLAKCASTDVRTLKELNPELLQWCTPPGVTGYKLRIPLGKAESFTQQFAQIPDDQKRDWSIHTVKKGETLSTIAYRYGLNASLLQETNNIKDSRKLAIGARLAIPLPKEILPGGKKVPFGDGMKAYIAKRVASSTNKPATKKTTSPSGKERLVYRVKRGDTIGHIAEWYGVRASDIRNWNDIAYGSILRVNQQILVWVDGAKANALKSIDELSFTEKQNFRIEKPKQVSSNGTISGIAPSQTQPGWKQYIIRSGDTLEKIAKQHGVSIADLKSWNSLRTSRIYPGQALAIYGEPDKRATIIQSGNVNGNISRSEALSFASADVVYHQVKRGDTLWDLAKKYGVTVKQLEEINDLPDGLKAGDRIAIPQR